MVDLNYSEERRSILSEKVPIRVINTKQTTHEIDLMFDLSTGAGRL